MDKNPTVNYISSDEGMKEFADKKYILTNYQPVRKGGKAADSDHNTQYIDLDLKVESVKPEQIEMFNFKDKEGQSNLNN